MPTDHDRLREALWLAKRAIDRGEPQTFTTQEMRALVSAAASTLPRTKMVEVWRVEYAYMPKALADLIWTPGLSIFGNETAARDEGDRLARCRNYACIRVTGPHQQEVPDDGAEPATRTDRELK